MIIVVIIQTLVIYALGVILQDSDTWSIPYRSTSCSFTLSRAHQFMWELGLPCSFNANASDVPQV